jgi:hypothetical protein
VDQSLDRKKDSVEKGLPSFENPLEVRTDWFDKKPHDNNKEPSLNGIRAHVKLREKNRGDLQQSRFGITSGFPTKETVSLWL